jgi:uroporphyrin-III C-methyltransferase
MSSSGIVYVVGAGPGDPGLITVRGLECLRLADVVLHDRLIDPRLLAEARADAVVTDVGKRVGDGGKGQRLIHDLMVQHARRGRRVCRLKGGDPFVFGRGGEEALFLAEAGVAWEIVPGVSSAIAAAGAAHIPVTHREHAHSFMVMTGSRADEASPEEWSGARSLIDGGGTLVVLMGLSRIEAIVSRLRDRGCPDQTPAAVVSRATFPDQETRVGTLADISDRSKGMESPAVLVFGPAVLERARLSTAVKIS